MPAVDGHQAGYAYEWPNRLVSATVSGPTTACTYDGDGKRATETVGSNPTTTYVYDTGRRLPVVPSDGARKYVWGPAGLAYSVDSSNNVTVYHPDGPGSVRALTNGSGTLVQTYQTDAFGNVTSSRGSSSQPFGYTGQQVDGDGLVYLRARYYAPASGRFMSRDPVVALPPNRCRSTATATCATTRRR